MRLLITFFYDAPSKVVIPDALLEREQQYKMLLISVFSASFLLISLARNLNSKSLGTVVSNFFRDSDGMEVRLKENMKLGSLSSVILLVNYFISFSLCNFIFFYRILLFEESLSFWLSLGTSFVVFAVEIFGLWLSGVLSGESKRLHIALLNTLTIAQFAGVFFTVIALFWIMNPGADKLFLSLFIAVFALKETGRLLKSSAAVLANGVTWYYLILYFCTLEILPLFVICIHVTKNFLK